MGRRRKKMSLLKAFKKGMKISKMMSKALDKFMNRRKLDRMLGQKNDIKTPNIPKSFLKISMLGSNQEALGSNQKAI